MGVCRSKYRTSASTVLAESKADVRGRYFIVTGATSGLGYHTAEVLAQGGAVVIIPGRNIAAARTAAATISALTKNTNVHAFQLDLGSLVSVRAFAKEYLSRGWPLHCLINNAGIMMCPLRYTADGFEDQMGTNHFGHFLLTTLLLPVLRSSAPSRVVNLSGGWHQGPALRFADLAAGPEKKAYDPWKCYQQSKLANILFTRELARRERSNGITSYSLHPGVIPTNLSRDLSTTVNRIFGLGKCVLKTIPQGAATQMYCAVQPGIESLSGEYFMNAQPFPSHASAPSKDMAVAAQLWEVSEKLIAEKLAAADAKPAAASSSSSSSSSSA